jgi:phage tail-like protein
MAVEDLDPYGNYYFALEIDGVEVAHFLEFSGLKTTAEVFEVREGGLNGVTHKRPGPSTFQNIILRYGTSASQTLAEWRDKYLNDEFGRRPNTSGAVVVKSNKGSEIKRYSFFEMWPVSWEGPAMSSSASALAIETLEVAFDGLTLDGSEPAPPPPPPEPPPPNNQPLAVEPIPFEFDSDKMKPEGEAACGRVANSINAMDPKPTTVYIEGHTCTMGSYAHNLALSTKRAAATKKEMESRSPGPTYISQGFSYTYPVASNATDAGRQQNRRTEFYETSPVSRGRTPGDRGKPA